VQAHDVRRHRLVLCTTPTSNRIYDRFCIFLTYATKGLQDIVKLRINARTHEIS